MALSSLYDKLNEACQEPDSLGIRLWGWLKEKIDLALYRPQATAHLETSALTGRDGPYFVLKNPDEGSYYQISEKDHFLWEKMDGTRSVKDLVVAYFLEYGTFAFGRVARLVHGLKANYMLEERPVRIYSQVNLQLLSRSLGYRLQQFGNAFMQRPFAVNGVDGTINWLYRHGGWLLFTRPMQVLYVIISIVGLILFVIAFQAGDLKIVAEINGSYVWGVVALAVILFFAILIHELAHALTVKHYGREVRRAGVMIYLGMPGFFVDTSDIWMEGKRARLAVTWAGPYSGLILSGVVAIIFTLWPEFPLNSVFFRFAFLSYTIVFLNVNPLLKLDGYYMLMDWLEIPNLRRKSFAFLRNGLPAKFRKGDQSESSREQGVRRWNLLGSFSREEIIFTVFGLLSALWTVYAVYLGMKLWGSRLIILLIDFFKSIFNNGGDINLDPLNVLTLLISAVFVAMMLLFVWNMVRKVLQGAAEKGIFANTWYVAGLLFIASVGVVVVVQRYEVEALAPILGLGASAAALYLSWRNFENYRGSRYASFFGWTGAAATGFSVLELMALIEITTGTAIITGTPWLVGLRAISYVALFAASISLWWGMEVRHLSRIEVVLIAVGVLGAVAGALWIYLRVDDYLSITLSLPGLVLALLSIVALVPTLFSHWGTTTSAAWFTCILALAALIGRVVFDLPALIFYLLFAGGLILHVLAFTLLPLSSDRPEAQIDVSDVNRLKRAFAFSIDSLMAQTLAVNGARQLHTLCHRFNHAAELAGWDLRLESDRLQDTLVGVTLIERGETYAEALNLFLELVRQQVGEKLTTRMFRNAYDGLPWEEREVASQYLFKHVERAADLSADFQSKRQDYKSLLRRMPIFATMSDGEIDLLLPRFRLEKYPAGRTIIRQGDRGDKFYIIHQGHVEVTQTDEDGVTEVVNQLSRGGYFGELALLSDAPRNATCKAVIPTETLTLNKDDFDELVKERFTMREKLDDSISNAEILRKIPLFAEMDGIQIQHISAKLQEETFQPGESLIRQGEIGDKFYVIKSGRVQVFVTEDGQEKEVVERGAGVYVGEIALLLDVPRTASVRALVEVVALTLHKADFDHLVHQHLYVSRELERESSRRMIDLRRVAPGSM